MVYDSISKKHAADEVTAADVVLLAHKFAHPYVMKENDDGSLYRADARFPRSMAVMYLGERGEWRLPPLNGITTTPLLDDDGTIRSVAGYDVATGVWLFDRPSLQGWRC